MLSAEEFVIDVVLDRIWPPFYPDTYSDLSAHPMHPAAIIDDEAISPPDKATEVEAGAPTDEDANGMDEGEDDGDGDDKIPETQADPLSFPILDSGRVKVEEPNHETTGFDDEV